MFVCMFFDRKVEVKGRGKRYVYCYPFREFIRWLFRFYRNWASSGILDVQGEGDWTTLFFFVYLKTFPWVYNKIPISRLWWLPPLQAHGKFLTFPNCKGALWSSFTMNSIGTTVSIVWSLYQECMLFQIQNSLIIPIPYLRYLENLPKKHTFRNKIWS